MERGGERQRGRNEVKKEVKMKEKWCVGEGGEGGRQEV